VRQAKTRVKRFSFGPYEVDVPAGELRKNGLRIQVQGKSFEVLVALLEQPHQLVTRQDLQQRLWPDGVSVDFDNSLNSAVNRLRDALRDGARKPRYIETLHHRGYRFIAPVEQVLIIPPRLAVLPFENLNRHPDQDFFGDALADGLTTGLGNVSTLRVISRQSVLHLKGTRKTLPEIASDLKADLVVGGCVLVDGDSIRITAQLVQAMPEQHLWSKAYSCRMGDILTTEGQVARDIAEAAQVTLSTAEVGRLSRQRPVDPEAHIAYLKALHYLGQRSLDGFHKCLQCLHLALAKDPTHAPAHAYMALCYSLLGFWGHLPGPEAYPRAKKAALKAIALDDALSVAHWVLGWVSWLHDWDLAACERETLRAIELNPSDEGAHESYAVFLAILSKDRAKAAAEAKLALDLDPLSLNVNANAAWTHLFVEEYGRARQQAQTTLELFPDALQAWYVLGWSELMHSRFDSAIQAFEKAAAISPDALSIGYLGHAHARAGRLDTATSLLHELLARLEQGYVPAKSLICLYAGLGERDRVIDWLEKAYQDRDPQLFFIGAVRIFGPMAELIQTWIRERLPHL
jgi:TolB-like protein/Tfp pilus assembly protein PilF